MRKTFPQKKQLIKEQFPRKIGKYTYVESFNIEDGLSEFCFGVYKRGEKKAICKAWFKGSSRLKKKSLINEIHAYRMLMTEKEAVRNSYIKFPRLLGSQIKNDRILLLIEFVEGKSMHKMSASQIVKNYELINQFLDSHSGNRVQNSSITKRGAYDYILLWHFYLIKLLIIDRVAFIFFVKKYAKVLYGLTLLLSKKIDTLVLRDMASNHNIFVKNRKISVIDLESMTYTYQFLRGVSALIVEAENYKVVNAILASDMVQTWHHSRNDARVFTSLLTYACVVEIVATYRSDKHKVFAEVKRLLKLYGKKDSYRGKKRIIISNYDDISNPYYGGGGAQSIHETAKRLSKTFNIIVLTGKYPSAKDETVDGVKYMRVGIPFGGPKLGQIFFQFAILLKARSLIYDVWVESLTPPFSASLLPLVAKSKAVALVHMLSGEDMQRKYKLPFQLVENFGVKFYRHFIVTQNEIAEKMRSINGSAAIQVIPNGVDLPITKGNRKVKHILYLGRLEVNQKGLDLLLDAYAITAKKVKLVIAGGGEEKQVKLLKKSIKQRGLDKYVHVIGRVAGEKKKKLIQGAFCVVVPSRFETFSIVSLESMACKVPVVSFDIAGLKWLPKTVGIKVKPFDINTMAKAITHLLENPALREKMGNSGYHFSKKMDWNSISKRYIKALSRV